MKRWTRRFDSKIAEQYSPTSTHVNLIWKMYESGPNYGLVNLIWKIYESGPNYGLVNLIWKMYESGPNYRLWAATLKTCSL
jgi:hypothetical protein